MSGTLTEKTSIVFREDTIEELKKISKMAEVFSEGRSKPKNSELIRFAVYKFIDDVLYPQRKTVFQNIRPDMSTHEDKALKIMTLKNLEFAVKGRDLGKVFDYLTPPEVMYVELDKLANEFGYKDSDIYNSTKLEEK